MRRTFYLALLAVLAVAGRTIAAETSTNSAASPGSTAAPTMPPPSTQTGVTFAKDIQPLFAKSCVRCHGGENPKAGLRLGTLEAALKGSAKRQVVIAGDSANSPLVRKITKVGKTGAFSHPKPPLEADQIGLVRAWIDQGAK
jgi:hypothetical protein